MLSRTANDVYWMSRHIERAENIARMLDVTYRMSLLPYRTPDESWAEPWALPLVITGRATDYYGRFPGELSSDCVLRYIALDPANPSSIYSCIQSARENARTARGAITSEMYEDINGLWLEIKDRAYDGILAQGISDFFDWVKTRSHRFRGVTVGTMLRDEAYQFIRLGTFIERADNTARILDVKYHTLLPSVTDVGGAVDYYQWGALLRSVSAFDSYRKVYRDVITPMKVAECWCCATTCRARSTRAPGRSTRSSATCATPLRASRSASRASSMPSCATAAPSRSSRSACTST
jgi:uncharacterized alpha-E superfamily protein